MQIKTQFGSETTLVNCEYSARKILVYPGRRSDFLYHPRQDKTLLVNSGRLLVRFVPPRPWNEYTAAGLSAEACRKRFLVRFLGAGESMHVPPDTPHQFEALSGNLGPVEFLELATHHDPLDVVVVLRHDDPVFTQPSWEARHARDRGR